MKEIKNIAFDLGGVLITNDSEGLVSNNKEAKELLKATGSKLFEGWIKNWPRFRTGKISEDEFLSRFISNLDCKDTEGLVGQMKVLYRQKVEALPLYSTMVNLQERYDLYAVTNISKEWLEFKTKKFDLERHFKGIIASSTEGVAKPNPEIFKRFVNKYGIVPRETVLIDDLLPTIIMARILGFKAIWFRSEEQATQGLKRLGITE